MMLRKASAMSNSANIDVSLLYARAPPMIDLKSGHYRLIVVDECLEQHHSVHFLRNIRT